MIIIETDRLIIRESSGTDFSRIYSMMLSVSPDETTDVVSADEDEELEKYLAYIHSAYSIFGFGLWSVCLKAQPGCALAGEVIGRCGLQAIADENSPLGRIELGYLIDKKYRRRGLGYEACSGIISYAFEKLGLEELTASISPGNIPSERLAARLGFEKTGNGIWKLTVRSFQAPDNPPRMFQRSWT